jgi:replication factor A1
MSSPEDLLNELQKSTNLSKEELTSKINSKLNELGGLVSFEGAAYLIARELGIDLPEKSRISLQIKNIVSGMRNVNVVGRVFRISSIIDFEKSDKTKGRVVNLFIGDSTGFFRLPLWNDQVKLVEDQTVKLGDMVQVTNAFARENIYNDIEISIGKYGTIKTLEDSDSIPAHDTLVKKFFQPSSSATPIEDLGSGSSKVKGTVVNVFKGNFFFAVCPSCGNSLTKVGNFFVCPEHKEIEPKQNLILSALVDDGTDDIRVVFFRDLAEKLLGTKTEEVLSLDQEKRYEFIREKLLGKEIQLTGRVKKSNISDRLEIIAGEVEDLNPLEESKKLVEDVELKGE